MKETDSLTRRKISDDDMRYTDTLLHWIWSWQLQWERFLKSWNTDYDQRTMELVEYKKLESHKSFDIHILLVTTRNLLRALENPPDWLSDSIETSLEEDINLLRNIYEHWNECGQECIDADRRSYDKFAKKYPDKNPYSIVYGPDDFYVGGVLPLEKLHDYLIRLESYILAHSGSSREIG